MAKTYIVRLTDEERTTLRGVIKTLSGSSQKVRRSQILIKADVDGPGWTDARIAEAFECRIRTVEKLRKRFVEEGFEIALNGKTRRTPPRKKILDGERRPKSSRCGLVRLRKGWSLRLLADELEIADSQRNGSTDAWHDTAEIQYCPPEANHEFVAHMEGVLATYELPYEAEGSGALHRATSATDEGNPHAHSCHEEARTSALDYEYERAGLDSCLQQAGVKCVCGSHEDRLGS